MCGGEQISDRENQLQINCGYLPMIPTSLTVSGHEGQCGIGYQHEHGHAQGFGLDGIGIALNVDFGVISRSIEDGERSETSSFWGLEAELERYQLSDSSRRATWLRADHDSLGFISGEGGSTFSISSGTDFGGSFRFGDRARLNLTAGYLIRTNCCGADVECLALMAALSLSLTFDVGHSGIERADGHTAGDIAVVSLIQIISAVQSYMMFEILHRHNQAFLDFGFGTGGEEGSHGDIPFFQALSSFSGIMGHGSVHRYFLELDGYSRLAPLLIEAGRGALLMAADSNSTRTDATASFFNVAGMFLSWGLGDRTHLAFYLRFVAPFLTFLGSAIAVSYNPDSNVANIIINGALAGAGTTAHSPGAEGDVSYVTEGGYLGSSGSGGSGAVTNFIIRRRLGNTPAHTGLRLGIQGLGGETSSYVVGTELSGIWYFGSGFGGIGGVISTLFNQPGVEYAIAAEVDLGFRIRITDSYSLTLGIFANLGVGVIERAIQGGGGAIFGLQHSVAVVPTETVSQPVTVSEEPLASQQEEPEEDDPFADAIIIETRFGGEE